MERKIKEWVEINGKFFVEGAKRQWQNCEKKQGRKSYKKGKTNIIILARGR